MAGIDLHGRMVDLDVWNLPDDEELIDRPQWVVWQSKIPYCARRLLQGADLGRAKASVTDPSTWSTYAEAVGAGVTPLQGIGFVVTAADGFCGLDLDHCRDLETGVIANWATRGVDYFTSYTEVTPSGTGLRIWIRAQKPGVDCKKSFSDGGAIEVYDQGRFFTLTGFHLEGTPATIETRQAQLEVAHAALWPPSPAKPPGHRPHRPQLSELDVLQRMLDSKHGAKIRRLWQGDIAGYGSPSEADLALCSHLYYWTDGDLGQVDALFRRSGLKREKWDDRHGARTYGEITLERVVGGGQ